MTTSSPSSKSVTLEENHVTMWPEAVCILTSSPARSTRACTGRRRAQRRPSPAAVAPCGRQGSGEPWGHGAAQRGRRSRFLTARTPNTMAAMTARTMTIVVMCQSCMIPLLHAERERVAARCVDMEPKPHVAANTNVADALGLTRLELSDRRAIDRGSALDVVERARAHSDAPGQRVTDAGDVVAVGDAVVVIRGELGFPGERLV